MSVYPDQEVTVSVYHADYDDETKKSSYPSTADFTILAHIIRRDETAIAIDGAEYGEYVANINGTYTNASSFLQGDKIVASSGNITGTFIVTNKPKRLFLVDKYKILLKATNK